MPARKPFLRQLMQAAGTVALVVGLGLPAMAQEARTEDAGAFLAAMVAAGQSDYIAAAEWHTRALLADPTNPILLEGALISNIGIGEIGAATKLALALQATGQNSEIGHLTLLASAIKAGDFAAVLEESKAGADQGALLDSLVKGWAQVGLGRMSEATKTFDTISKTKGNEGFGLYHKALALASAGDFEGADEILSGRADGPIALMRTGVIAHAQILSQLERNPDALAMLGRAFVGELDSDIVDLRRRLEAGEPVPYDVVTQPADGLGQVFYDIATALSSDAPDTYTLTYARFAQYLLPEQTEATVLVAGLLEGQGQHDLATQAFALVPVTEPMFHIAEIGRASATYEAGRKDAAIEILQALSRSHSQILGVHVALADTYRREERFAEAKASYDTAISMLGAADSGQWVLYFSRGICAEQTGDFAGAEADMRKALALNPDEPRVLNYLGYSFVDRGEKLDEALAMIERAVAREPGSGYIIDSLAWAYYRLGRYADAVEPMERASLLEPVDPIVTDHLGDVYWAVGRTREAEFQWRRALSYGPLEKDAVRIRAKLEKGLDAVLADEGAKPIAPVEATAND